MSAAFIWWLTDRSRNNYCVACDDFIAAEVELHESPSVLGFLCLCLWNIFINKTGCCTQSSEVLTSPQPISTPIFLIITSIQWKRASKHSFLWLDHFDNNSDFPVKYLCDYVVKLHIYSTHHSGFDTASHLTNWEERMGIKPPPMIGGRLLYLLSHSWGNKWQSGPHRSVPVHPLASDTGLSCWTDRSSSTTFMFSLCSKQVKAKLSKGHEGHRKASWTDADALCGGCRAEDTSVWDESF